VCRFYAPGAHTHFYTAEPAECAQVKLDPGWSYEGFAFRAQVPVAGACPQGTVPVYRAYNNRFAFQDSNHRFTTSLAIYNGMTAQGWLAEGVVMCAVA
jgi:serine protease